MKTLEVLLYLLNLFKHLLHYRVGLIPNEPDHINYKKVRTDASFEGVIIQPLLKILYKNKALDKSSRYIICKEIFKMIPLVIYSSKNFFLLDAINQKIEVLKASGLIEFWHFQDVDRRNLKTSEGPKVLTFNHLLGIFEILSYGYAFSFSVFMLEKLFVLTKSGLRKLNVLFNYMLLQSIR